MASKIGNAAAVEARGVPEFDLLASGVDRENNSASAQAESSTTVTVAARRRPAQRKGDPPMTRKYEAHGRLAVSSLCGDSRLWPAYPWIAPRS